MSGHGFGLYDSRTGRLVSLRLQEPAEIPAGLELVTFDPPFDFAVEMWDEESKSRVPRPTFTLVDRVDDILADARLSDTIAKVNSADRDALRSVIGEILGPLRFRAEIEEPQVPARGSE